MTFKILILPLILLNQSIHSMNAIKSVLAWAAPYGQVQKMESMIANLPQEAIDSSLIAACQASDPAYTSMFLRAGASQEAINAVCGNIGSDALNDENKISVLTLLLKAGVSNQERDSIKLKLFQNHFHASPRLIQKIWELADAGEMKEAFYSSITSVCDYVVCSCLSSFLDMFPHNQATLEKLLLYATQQKSFSAVFRLIRQVHNLECKKEYCKRIPFSWADEYGWRTLRNFVDDGIDQETLNYCIVQAAKAGDHQSVAYLLTPDNKVSKEAKEEACINSPSVLYITNLVLDTFMIHDIISPVVLRKTLNQAAKIGDVNSIRYLCHIVTETRLGLIRDLKKPELKLAASLILYTYEKFPLISELFQDLSADADQATCLKFLLEKMINNDDLSAIELCLHENIIASDLIENEALAQSKEDSVRFINFLKSPAIKHYIHRRLPTMLACSYLWKIEPDFNEVRAYLNLYKQNTNELYNHPPFILAVNKHHGSWLTLAVIYKDLSAIESLVEIVPWSYITKPDEYGCSPLDYAILLDYGSIVNTLTAALPKIDQECYKHRRALNAIIAAKHGNIFLAYNEIARCTGRTPLF